MLAAIETEGARYELKLNEAKCEYMKFGVAGPVKFADGSKLNPTDEVKYLGNLLDNRADPQRYVKKRLVDATITFKRLSVYFRYGDTSIRERLHIYEAVIRSKLMYGLESTAMNTSVLNRLDAFQMKVLRQVLGK